MRRFTVAVVVGVLVLGASACAEPSTGAGEEGSGTDTSQASPTHASETTSPTEAPSISPAHAAEPGEPELIQVDGYAYRPADEATDARIQEMLKKLPDIYAGGSAHDVVSDGSSVPAGRLLLLSLTPDARDLAESDAKTFRGGYLGGMMAGNTGVSPTNEVMIAGEKVATATADNGGLGGVAFAWIHEGTVGGFFGLDAEDAEAFVTAYLAEANG